MTIKEFSTRAGISAQAVYKRLRNQGINLDTIRNKETGQLTAEGETIVENLFSTESHRFSSDESENQRLSTEVERLKTEVERLSTALDIVSEERNYLREQLKASQVIQLETLKKLPQALPAPAERKKPFWPWRKKE